MSTQTSQALVFPHEAVTISGSSRFEPKALLKLCVGLLTEFREVQDSAIEDAEDEQCAAERLRDIRTLDRQIGEYEEELKRPHLDALKQIRELCKPFRSLLALGVGAYGGAIEHYRVSQAEERAAALEAARDAARARETPKLAEALNAAQEAKPQKLDGVSAPLEWQVAKIEDPLAVPRGYCVPDEKRIAAFARQHHPDPLRPPVLAGVVFKLGVRMRVSR